MPDQLEVTLVLRQPEASHAIAERLLTGTFDPTQLDPSDISASASDVEAVTQFAVGQGLQVLKTDPAARTVRVSGTPADIEKAFDLRSSNADEGSVQSLNYKGPVNMPSPINQIVIAVLGLDHSSIARHHA